MTPPNAARAGSSNASQVEVVDDNPLPTAEQLMPFAKWLAPTPLTPPGAMLAEPLPMNGAMSPLMTSGPVTPAMTPARLVRADSDRMNLTPSSVGFTPEPPLATWPAGPVPPF